MALSAVTNNICQKLDNMFTEYLNTVKASYQLVSGNLNMIKTMISGMNFSGIDVLQNAAAQVQAGLDNVIPDFTDEFSDILNMINSCAFLRTDKTLKNPLTLIRSLKSSIMSDAQNIFNSLTSALAEFNVARLMDTLFVKYSDGFNFDDIIPNMYKIIDCVDSLCPNTDITSNVLTFENYINRLYLLVNGRFDKVRFFDELKLSAEQITKINIGLDSYEYMRNRITDSITNGVNFAKSLI